MVSPLDQQLAAAIKKRDLSRFSELLVFAEVLQGKDCAFDEVHLKDTYLAACRAAIVGQLDFLRALRRHCGQQDFAVREYVSCWAAKHGKLGLLDLANLYGLPWSPDAAFLAAENGHADCLKFALLHCPRSVGDLLVAAIKKGHLACVQLLVARGLPHGKPYIHYVEWFHKVEPQIRCLQHLFEQGCPMHPGNIIIAARAQRLDYMRFLHKQGVPLWTRACEADSYVDLPGFPGSARDQHCLDNNILPIPEGQEAAGMLDILRWAHACGAPVTPAIEDLFRAKRAATRAVLLSFHGATRLRRGDGTRAQRSAWASMQAIPHELVEDILVKAGLEIPETVGRGLPSQRLVEVEGRWIAPWDYNETEEFNTWHYAA